MPGMDVPWKAAWPIGILLLAAAAFGNDPAPAPAETPVAAPLLTLSSSLLRTAVGGTGTAWRLPDFRLKVESPAWESLWTPSVIEGRVRAVEIRLPMPDVWVGYETAPEGANPRATFSIQRDF